MQIKAHRLARADGSLVPFVATPNMGGALKPRWLVMHYTAGTDSVPWLANPQARVSAHLVIARAGEIVQMVPFDRQAWHAGASAWKGVTSLNAHSIGIELENLGRLERKAGRWQSWQGVIVPDVEVHVTGAVGWHRYTPAQIAAARLAARALVLAYKLEDVVGHEDISPGRKIDPGPAFPMAEFRRDVMRPEQPPREIGPLAQAIVEQRWTDRAVVTVDDVQAAASVLLRLTGSAAKAGVNGAAVLRETLADVLSFYAR